MSSSNSFESQTLNQLMVKGVEVLPKATSRLRGESSSSLGGTNLLDLRVLRNLQIMKGSYDQDQIMTLKLLEYLCLRFSISLSTRCKYLCLYIDALEVGLRFFLHPFIFKCLHWWRISSSWMLPNPWYYLVVFIRKCYYDSTVPNLNLFLQFSSIQAGQWVLPHNFEGVDNNGRYFYIHISLD